MSEQKRILIIEDEPDIAELVIFNFQIEGFAVYWCKDGDHLETLSEVAPLDVIILDIMLPKRDGLSVLQVLRQNSLFVHVPVIMLSAKGEEADIVRGLDLGADDYLSKPFSVKELLARVKALIRRAAAKKANALSDRAVLECYPLKLDVRKYEVTVADELVPLTMAEFRLLHALMVQPDQVQTRDQLIEKITKGEAIVIERNVDVHIRALRKKLQKSADPIQTIRGVGYKWRSES